MYPVRSAQSTDLPQHLPALIAVRWHPIINSAIFPLFGRRTLVPGSWVPTIGDSTGQSGCSTCWLQFSLCARASQRNYQLREACQEQA